MKKNKQNSKLIQTFVASLMKIGFFYFCSPFCRKVEGDFLATSCVQKISLGEKAVSLKEIP